MDYKCISCNEGNHHKDWNIGTNEVYENNNAKLPRDFIKNDIQTSIQSPDYMSDPGLPAFCCPGCGFMAMANELVEVRKVG